MEHPVIVSGMLISDIFSANEKSFKSTSSPNKRQRINIIMQTNASKMAYMESALYCIRKLYDLYKLIFSTSVFASLGSCLYLSNTIMDTATRKPVIILKELSNRSMLVSLNPPVLRYTNKPAMRIATHCKRENGHHDATLELVAF